MYIRREAREGHKRWSVEHITLNHILIGSDPSDLIHGIQPNSVYVLYGFPIMDVDVFFLRCCLI